MLRGWAAVLWRRSAPAGSLGRAGMVELSDVPDLSGGAGCCAPFGMSMTATLLLSTK